MHEWEATSCSNRFSRTQNDVSTSCGGDVHACRETMTNSCSRQSRRSFGLQKLDDSAHSCLAEPSLCASHPSDKQDNMPAYLTELTPLSTTSCFCRPKHTMPTPLQPHPAVLLHETWGSKSSHSHSIFTPCPIRATVPDYLGRHQWPHRLTLKLFHFTGLYVLQKHNYIPTKGTMAILFFLVIIINRLFRATVLSSNFKLPIPGAVCPAAPDQEPTLKYTSWEWMWFSAAYGELFPWLCYCWSQPGVRFW